MTVLSAVDRLLAMLEAQLGKAGGSAPSPELDDFSKIVKAPLPESIAPPLPASKYIASEESVATLLLSLDRAAIEAVVHARLADAAQILTSMESQPWRSSAVLDGIRQTTDRYAWPALAGPSETDSKNRPLQKPWLYLASNVAPTKGVGKQTSSTRDAFKLIRQVASKTTTSASARKSWDTKRYAALLSEVRRASDVLARFKIAQAAAAATGSELSTALALYRIEGALNVPSSAGSLSGADVQSATGALVPQPPERTDFEVNLGAPYASFHVGVWIASRALIDPSIDAGRVAELAHAQYCLTLAGLDQMYDPTIRPTIPGESMATILDWLAWLYPGGTLQDRRRQARAEFVSSYRLLATSSEFPPGAPPIVYVIAPTLPIDYVSWVLSVALRLLEKCRDQVFFMSGPPLDLGPDWGYLAYHRGQIGTRAMILSALASVKDRKPASAGNLVTAVAAASPQEKQTLVLVSKGGGSPTETAQYWPDLESFVRRNIIGIRDYIYRASRTDWPYYLDDRRIPANSVRGNVHRYAQLRLFFATWLGE